MKILITGGAGFIGSNIAKGYLEAGHKVAILDNFSSGKRENIPNGAKVYELSVENSEILNILQEFKPDIVNHHAAQIDVRKSVDDPCLDAKINIIGSLNLFESCLKTSVKKIIFASSGGTIYGEQISYPASEDHPVNPTSPYGIAKLAIEKYLQFYHWTHNLPFVALRYANVYGSRQNPFGEAGVIAIFIHKLLKGEVPIIYGDGTQTRDYIFVDDVVSCNLAALESNISGIYNVGTGIETDVNSLTKKLIELIRADVYPVHEEPRPGEQKRSCLKPGALQNQPLITLEDGLKRTVNWFRKQHSLSHIQ